MRRAHLRRQHQFGRIDIDGDDRPCSGQPRTLHRGEAYRAAADHHHGIAMRNGAEVERGTRPGHHAAANQAGAVERDFLWHGNGLLIGDDAVFAEGAQEHQLLQ